MAKSASSAPGSALPTPGALASEAAPKAGGGDLLC